MGRGVTWAGFGGGYVLAVLRRRSKCNRGEGMGSCISEEADRADRSTVETHKFILVIVYWRCGVML